MQTHPQLTADLSPAEFLRTWRKLNATSTYVDEDGNTVIKHRNGSKLNSDAELLAVFDKDPKAYKSSNQFKQACGRAGLSISHDRARRLYNQKMGLTAQDKEKIRGIRL